MKVDLAYAERQLRYFERLVARLRQTSDASDAEKETEEKRDLPPIPPIERKEEKEKDSPQRVRARDALFNEFWAAYPGPRKKDKRKCREKYALILRDASDPLDLQAKILAGIERWKRCKDWVEDGGAFICAPLVWLRNERWEAEVAPAVVTISAPKTREISRPASYLKPTQAQIDKVKGLF